MRANGEQLQPSGTQLSPIVASFLQITMPQKFPDNTIKQKSKVYFSYKAVIIAVQKKRKMNASASRTGKRYNISRERSVGNRPRPGFLLRCIEVVGGTLLLFCSRTLGFAK